ncbi:hypothetical protein TTHERM_00316380 (macronuclear) [Tetrahymena thermophila SB210]|uniref:Tetratricopeptide repeat protein n=1 Tax=Tetrahymena thermophila (strain SB210) TaxID=312017 RepID=I7LW72_TETTS|nr:hypothetical protein TTHERM_00316380 [Tetrahymena thermophila SB210]EAS01085.2 hypothetical protein TTHERM_00316380 [Tetrahymena thermophila SB210]|eukprot:XP_001021330.2 hypothetical protein TTHERM_00316380 [Tetrahymena thermophila SB210]
MEISELLRRGNFSRSQIFQSYIQGSQNSLNDQDAASHVNYSKSPTKANLNSKCSMNNTKNSDISYSSQYGRDKFFIIRKNNSKDTLAKGVLKNQSQMSLNDESLINIQNTYKSKANQSTGAGYFSSVKSETQFTNNIDEDTKTDAQILSSQKKNAHHKKIVSMDHNYSGQNEQWLKKIYPQSQQQSRRNKEKLSLEKEKLQEILTQSTAFASPKKYFHQKSQSGSQITNYGQTFYQPSSQKHKRQQSQTSQNDTFKHESTIESPMPKTSKQNLFQESSKNQNPYFNSVKAEAQSRSTTNNFKYFLKDIKDDKIQNDNQLNTSDQNIKCQTASSQTNNQTILRNTATTKKFRSQEKYQEQNQSQKNFSSKINPFFSSTKDQNKKPSSKLDHKLSQRNIQIGNISSPISEYFEDQEQYKKIYNGRNINQNISSKTIENSCKEILPQKEDNQAQHKSSYNFNTIVNIVRMKKKVNEIVKKNQETNHKKMKESEDSGSDSDKQANKHNAQFQSHKTTVHTQKNDEGCDIHDIYGTFNDKIKQLQDQIYEAIQDYQLAYTIIEHVEKEKNQSRVIDTVENTIQSIFLSLDFLEKIPNHINEREEIDKILSQQALAIMKSTQANLVIQIETVLIYAKYCKAICNFGKALRLYKQCKNMSISPLMQRYRMKSYKSIGQCFSNLKLYNMSLLYFGKYLECAWYLDDTDAELQAYDLIGMTHYLLGDLELAKFYHEKMIQNDNEPSESVVKTLNSKKIVEKLKKLNTEEYIQKMAVSYKKFFAKIHSIDYEEDYECSSSDDEFKISIPKTSSQKKNQDYEQYLRDLSPNAKKKLESEKKRFIAIYNAEDKFAQLQIKQQANQNIRMLEYKRMAFQLPPQLKYTSAKSFKPINSTQKFPFRINQFSINRNLDNYLAQDQRILKYLNFDFYKLVEDSNDKKLKHKIVQILSKFQNNLIFALSQIHCLRERDKYKQNKRRFAFSGVADFNKPNNLILMNINFSQEKMQQALEEKKKFQPQEDKSKPNSNKQKFLFIQRFQMPSEVESYYKK